MVCHCSRLANDPSVPLEKKCTSSGSRRSYVKLCAIRPPSPCTQVLTLTVTGKGSLPSLKVVCQPTSSGEEDATLKPTWAVGWMLPVGSRIVIPPRAREGGFLEGGSPRTLGGCSKVHCLFWAQATGGGGGMGVLPWGCYYCATRRDPDRKRSMIMVCLTTISSSLWSGSASEEFTDSTSACSACWTWTGAWGSSTGLWIVRFWEIVFIVASLRVASDFVLTIQGQKSRASPTVREGGSKLGCRTLMYDSRRLSTSRA